MRTSDDLDCDQAADQLMCSYVNFMVLRTSSGYQLHKFKGAGWDTTLVAEAPTFVELARRARRPWVR